MNKAFEKILERLDSHIEDAKSEGDFSYIKPFEIAKRVVQAAAEEYKKETYFNLDHVTLHKCPKCGGNTQHRVNQKGSWACGCFECGLFKSDYDHQKAIQEWEDYCKEYNNGWIPCSERLPEEKDGVVLICDENGEVETGRYSEFSNQWYIGDMCAIGGSKVIAWQPLQQAYKEGE